MVTNRTEPYAGSETLKTDCAPIVSAMPRSLPLPVQLGRALSLLVLLVILPPGGRFLPVSASHVRYGSVVWEPVPNRTNTISVTVRLAYRKGFYRKSRQIGAPFRTIERLQWHKGARANYIGNFATTPGGKFDGWVYSTAKAQHTYTQQFVDSNSYWDISVTGCCRLGNMRANSHKSFSLLRE